LREHSPDIIELGSYYVEPWAVFAYRGDLQQEDRNCLIGCYFHTDVAEAYVGAPLHELAQEWSHTVPSLARLADKFAHLAEARAEKYVSRLFEHCDLAFASSPAEAARLREYGVREPQTVPLGVDLELFKPSRRSEEIRARYGAASQNLVLFYAGRLSAEKEVLVLVEAFKKLPARLQALLWMAGHGPLYDELQEMMRGSIETLHLMPYENDRESFARLLASADIYVTAGPHETFGLSVIEAQASGLPVVGVDAGALRDRVVPGTGYLGPAGDAAAMASNIVQTAAERAALGARARQHVAENFSWSSTFSKLLACYAAEFGRLSPSRS